MNQQADNQSIISKFASTLAEQENLLRLSASDRIAHNHTWPVVAQLKVQSELLGGLSDLSGNPEWRELGLQIKSIATLGSIEPHIIPDSWAEALNNLATYLDNFFNLLDEGDSPGTALMEHRDDPGWSSLDSRFSHLDTPFLVMDDLEEALNQWKNLWCDVSLSVEQEKELREYWARLRQFGDAMFFSAGADDADSLLKWDNFGGPRKI
ncbi:MAG: hypothetical protein GY780_07930 [bacterium]|nr:hypothetical protein [bacterium]